MMRIKLDENLPVALSSRMRELGHDADTVAEERLVGSNDETLWRAAQADERFFITQDLGFSDARRYPAGSHFGILVLRLGNLRMIEIVERVAELFQTESVEQWARCCVVATQSKVRVTRPQ